MTLFNNINMTELNINQDIDRKEYFEKEDQDTKLLAWAKNILEQIKKANPYRALWELSQNARDTARNQGVNIIIHLTDTDLSFSHDGAAFRPNSLKSLIRQQSSKNNQENPDQIGQYGTGFATTHTFSDTVILSAPVNLNTQNEKEPPYYPLRDFVIDRQASESNILKDKIRQALQQVDNLIYDTTRYSTTPDFCTSFRYPFVSPVESQRNQAIKAILDVERYVAFVLIANPEIRSFTLKIETTDSKIASGESRYEITAQQPEAINITKSGYLFQTVRITSQGDCLVAIPVDEENRAYCLGDAARLFVGFPLIGSENFGVNFQIHSLKFTPTEERNGIFDYDKTSEQAHRADLANQKILLQTSREIFAFMQVHGAEIKDVYHLATVTINQRRAVFPDLQQFIDRLHRRWVNTFKKIAFVPTPDGTMRPPCELHFFTPEIYDFPDFDAIYSITLIMWPNEIPAQSVAVEWSRTVHTWDQGGHPDNTVKYITLEKIVEQIKTQPCPDGGTWPDHLLKAISSEAYQRFCAFIYLTKPDLLMRNPILPNRNNCLCPGQDLRVATELNDRHIPCFDTLGLNLSAKLIHSDFASLGPKASLIKYTNTDLGTDFSTARKMLELESFSELGLSPEKRNALIQLCNTFPRLDDISLQASGNVMPEVVEFWGLDALMPEEYRYEDPNNKFDVEPVRILLLHDLIVQLTRQGNIWNYKNQELIGRVVSRCSGYQHYREVTIDKPDYKIFLNQNYEFVAARTLYCEADQIREELKDLYDRVMTKHSTDSVPGPIRHRLLLPTLSSCWDQSAARQSSQHLAIEITACLKQSGDWNRPDEHPYQAEIREIVTYLLQEEERNFPDEKRYWQTHFAELNKDKAVIMMSQFANNEHMLTILRSGEDSIKIFGSLLNNKTHMDFLVRHQTNLDQMFQYAEEREEQNKRDSSHKKHIKFIGENIQNEILQQLGLQLQDATTFVEDQQGGQDFIIRNDKGQALYYIEIKSRWSTQRSVELSSRQCDTAYNHPTNYAVVVVDMSKRQDLDNWQPTFIEFEPYIKVVTDAGAYIQHVVSPEGGADAKTICLTGYEGNVTQDLFKEGYAYQEFVDYLRDMLSHHKKITDE